MEETKSACQRRILGQYYARLDFPLLLLPPGLPHATMPALISPCYYTRLDFSALLRPPGLPRATMPAWTSPCYYARLDLHRLL